MFLTTDTSGPHTIFGIEVKISRPRVRRNFIRLARGLFVLSRWMIELTKGLETYVELTSASLEGDNGRYRQLGLLRHGGWLCCRNWKL